MKPVEIEFLVKNNTRQGLSGVSGGIDGVEKDAMDARKQIEALEAEVARLSKTMSTTPKMDQSDNIRQIETLQARIKELEEELGRVSKSAKAVSETAKNTTIVPSDATKAKSTFNGLNMSIQQLARELPVLSMGPQMFFMAISNNLPIFTDELARARKEYEAMIASGQKGVPVWRQVLSSLLSWQTALAVGITLTVAYGKEIGNWVTNLFRGKKALDTARMATERFQNTMLEGARNAQQEVVKLNLLYRAATDNARATDDRREAVRKLKEEFSGYFKNLSDEQIMLGQANDTYKELIKNIYKYAKAQAAFKSLVDIEQQELFFNNIPYIEQFLKANDKYLEAQKDVADKRKIYDAATWTQRGNASKMYKDLSWAETILSDAEESVSYWQERIFEEIRKNKGGEEIIDEIEEKFDGNLGAFLQFLAEQRTKLAAVAEQAQLLENPSGTTTDPEPTSIDQLTEQYKAAVRRQQQSLDDQRVELIENEFDREREAIRLNYEKNRQEYERQEQQTLALIRKLRESGADIDSNAEKTFMAGTAAAIAQAAEIRDRELADVDKKEEASYTKLLEKYETYQQGRLRIARKYDQDIAALASNPEAQRLAREAKQKALDDFTEQFASQFPEFEAWADRVVAASVKKLESLVIEAQEELENL